MPRTTRLDRILQGLRDKDPKVRKASRAELATLSEKTNKLPAVEGLKALRAAAEGFRYKRPDPGEVCEELVDLAAGDPRPEYVPAIVASFEKYPDRAKGGALSILAQLESREAARAYMQLLREHAEAGRVPGLVIWPLEREPRHADIFFPELLRYAGVPALAFEIYTLCRAYRDAGLISDATLEPIADHVLGDYRALAEELRPAQCADGVAWMWTEPYSDARFRGALLLDLLGHFPAAKTESDLKRAQRFRDPRLKYFAIVSLLRRGKPVDPAAVADASASAEMRIWLYAELDRRRKLSLIPDRYRTQSALAESDLVNWLTFPTELGRVPDEIELMKVVPVDTRLPGGIYDYFVFRFRTHPPHWAAKFGWMAGVSGPFRRSDQPTTEALGETFSSLDPWDSKKPEQHVGDIRNLMKRWREYHAKAR
jgi:hypothetical protein